MEAWLQSGTEKAVPNLRDKFDGVNLKGGHLVKTNDIYENMAKGVNVVNTQKLI